MKSTKWSRLARVGAALCAIGLATGAAMLVANPAQAAVDEDRHCLVILPHPGFVKCFANEAEARAFGENAVIGPSKQGGTEFAQGIKAPASTNRLAVGPTVVTYWLLSIEYAGTFYTGDRMYVYGTAGPCSLTTGDTDYALPDWGSFSQEIASFKTYNVCWTKHYDLINYLGTSVGYQGTQAVISLSIYKDTSSEKWS